MTPCLDIPVIGGPGAVAPLEEVVLGRREPVGVGIVIPGVLIMVERVVGRSVETWIDVGGTEVGGTDSDADVNEVGCSEVNGTDVGGSEVGPRPWTSGMRTMARIIRRPSHDGRGRRGGGFVVGMSGMKRVVVVYVIAEGIEEDNQKEESE